VKITSIALDVQDEPVRQALHTRSLQLHRPSKLQNWSSFCAKAIKRFRLNCLIWRRWHAHLVEWVAVVEVVAVAMAATVVAPVALTRCRLVPVAAAATVPVAAMAPAVVTAPVAAMEVVAATAVVLATAVRILAATAVAVAVLLARRMGMVVLQVLTVRAAIQAFMVAEHINLLVLATVKRGALIWPLSKMIEMWYIDPGVV
jgi:hypothetical protein